MALTWADKRRTYVIGGAVLVGLMLLAGTGIAVMYEAPSCANTVQDGDETGVDCGGSCAYLCTADVTAPNIVFARAVTSGSRTDVIAYVENRNREAEAKAAQYTVEVFDGSGALLGTKQGVIDLPAYGTVPLFVPGVALGIGSSPRAFVSFEEDMRWRSARTQEDAIAVRDVELSLGDAPRVKAVVSNISPGALYNQTFVATIFGADDVALAASQTVVREVPGLGTANVIFTWNEPFIGTAVRVEVRALPRLP